MRNELLIVLVACTALLLPSFAAADPPDHAPAHGYRAKQKKQGPKAPAREPRSGGIEVIFDSERGIRVAVGLPGVFYHDGFYYRRGDGGWEVSVNGDGGWRARVTSKIPDVVLEAGRKPHPGPAKRKGPKPRKQK